MSEYKQPETFPCQTAIASQEKSRFLRLLHQAAEQRQINKSVTVAPNLETMSIEQQEELLFVQIFRSLGYSFYADAFTGLAEAWPYAALKKVLPQSNAKAILMGNWAKALNLFSDEEPIHASIRDEWNEWQAIEPVVDWSSPSLKVGGRPQNHPWRRLTGLFHHLSNTSNQGLLKTWLKILWEVEAKLADQEKPKKILEYINQLFEPQEAETFSHLLLPQSKFLSKHSLSLVGEARLNIVLANGIIPFFLSWARKEKDQALEKTLFALFMCLPGEGGNHKTESLQERFWDGGPAGVKKNLAYYQGMIQIYDDWCGEEPDCKKCGFLKQMGGKP